MNTINKVLVKKNVVSVYTRFLSTFINGCSISIPKIVPHTIPPKNPILTNNLVKEAKTIPFLPHTAKEKMCPSILDRFIFEYEVPRTDNNSAFENEKTVIGDCPVSNSNNGIKANKQDLFWRQRRMRRHRLLRWRQQHKKLYVQQITAKLRNRKKKHAQELKLEWKKLGLKKEPPKLTEEEKSKLVNNWFEQNLWKETLTEAELREFMRVRIVRNRTDKK
uniref:Uncharacterized protein LOC100185126 n=1 Tax=Phallusia mammillata TaxID=59560 RepID=A0A6F9DHH2_9ASCI|nr:uncharacterized protein LOC100185126 [Phallusia mammillata]